MPRITKNAEMSEVVGYTIPKLYTGKEWYVGFYAFNPIEGKMKIKRIKLNHIDKVPDRRKYAADLIMRLNEKLRRGWNPWIEAENTKSYTTFDEACDAYERMLSKHFKDDLLREDSFVSYKSYLRNLRSYNQKQKPPATYIYQLNRDYLNEFLDHIYIDRENSAQTRDNYLTWLRVFCRYLVKQGYHKTLATDGIDMFGKRSRKKNRTIIPMEKLEQLKNYASGCNKHYLLACYILFYCFIRPKEMSLIRIMDISIEKKTIFIAGENAKNRKDAIVTINKKIVELMDELGIFSNPGSYYLFGYGFMPGQEYRSEKQFRDYWTHYIRPILKFPKEYKFYSLKDSGVTLLLRSKVDNISVRDQARHSTILMTDTYTPHDIQEANPILANFDSDF